MNYPSPVGEVRLSTMRETPVCDVNEPSKVADYHRDHVTTSPAYQPDRENMVVLFLDTRRNVMGHEIVSTGVLDSCCVHARELFRAAIITNSHSIIIMHNHPSGETQPSEADIRITRNMIRAGQTLGIELTDHVITGNPAINNRYTSLRELGYFYQ